jgi:hypothetical protein
MIRLRASEVVNVTDSLFTRPPWAFGPIANEFN